MSTFNLSRMPPNGCSAPMLDVCPGPWAAQEEYHVLSPRWPCAIETSVEVVPRGISPTSLWCGQLARASAPGTRARWSTEEGETEKTVPCTMTRVGFVPTRGGPTGLPSPPGQSVSENTLLRHIPQLAAMWSVG